MNAPTAPNEEKRIEALRSYHILDTGSEQMFDDIPRLVSRICDVPISTLSLLDECRQWFKARVGIDAQETPRNIAFCAHTILGSDPLIVRDATKDDRFSNSPLVTGEPCIRFYAGFPVVDADGNALGALCAIDRRPRKLSDDQIDAMKALARQVMTLLTLRRVSDQLAQALEQVKELQGLLPICAWCKSIRDDQGYWKRLETYLHANSSVRFTHGICPTCLEKQEAKYITRAS
jgi:GAF domain-containing protein